MLSDALCGHIARIDHAALPEATRNTTKLALLDAMGVMLAASGLSEEVRPFLALAEDAPAGTAAILGTGRSASAAVAALTNGALGHALDYEDAFDRAPCHPNAALVPAVLAMAQALGGVDGGTFLAAMAAGCDLNCRMALSLRRPMEAGGWYPPPIIGAFGATAAAARIAGLDAEATRSALSLALCQAVMPGEIKHSRATTIRAVREAFPAQAAVQAVLLARAGVTGFEAPLEGPAGFYALYAGSEYDPADLLDGLGESFYGEDLTFKAWPACRGTHAYIEAALRLRETLDWREIVRIEAPVGTVQRMLVTPAARKAAPETAIDAKFSIPFTLALALVRGRVGLDDFDAASRSDADVLRMASLVEAVEDETRIPSAFAGEVTVVLRDGRVLSEHVATALGNPERPLGRGRLLAKFRDCAARAAVPLSAAGIEALAEQILELEQLADIRALEIG